MQNVRKSCKFTKLSPHLFIRPTCLYELPEFISFLSNRSQQKRVGNAVSVSTKLISGVVQGGAIIYIIY